MVKLKFFVGFFILFQINCSNQVVQQETPDKTVEEIVETPAEIVVGAARLSAYLPLIQNETVALVVNQTSTVGDQHLADVLQGKGVKIARIFAPEHGFRGTADAGEQIKDGKDVNTGAAVLSLYGKKKKPEASDLVGVDRVIFGIQDVGARFYTYISTMHYVMEACAENGIPMLVLDRPNPNAHYVDGPILEKTQQSFVGMHPIPIVHGMTVGEYAQMVNGENWLADGLKCDLKVVTVENYTHDTPYILPIKPSPNLPNARSIYLYPSLCLFEGTTVSVGRGTDKQFQIYGSPDSQVGTYEFIPEPMPGAKYPKHEGKLCKGYDLTTFSEKELQEAGFLNLNYLIDFYKNHPDQPNFFLKNLFFDKLAGTTTLRKQIQEGKTFQQIQASWQNGLTEFKKTRAKYLLYE